MTIESAVTADISDVEGFFAGIGTDMKGFFGGIATVAIADAKIAYLAFWAILKMMTAQQIVIFKDLVATASTDLAADDYLGVVNDVIARAKTDETQFILTLPTEVLTVFVAAFKGTSPAPAPA